MRKGICLTFLMNLAVFGGSVTQTDWSGGPGTPGPVSEWGSAFLESSGISWAGVPGSVYIGLEMIEPTRFDIDDADGPNCILAADMDGDGDQDVLASCSFYFSNIYWYENTDGTAAGLARHEITDFQAVMCGCCDIDGDGDMDVYSGSPSSGFHEVWWWENADGTGTLWTERVVEETPGEVSGVDHGDLDGDGDNDLMVSCNYPSSLIWMENLDGTGTGWTEHAIDTPLQPNSETNMLRVDDINGDGMPDAVAATDDSIAVLWLENDFPVCQWPVHVVSSGGPEARDILPSDIDLDGQPDLTVAEGSLCWWRNEGSGISWTRHVIDDTLTVFTTLWNCDIDLDGDQDILAGSMLNHDVHVIENADGTGGQWSEHMVDDQFWGCSSLSSIDLDGNGTLEVLGAAFVLDCFSLWEVTGFEPDGQLTSSILDLDEDPQWASLDWNCTEPAGTELFMQYRSSTDPGDMGQWSPEMTVPSVLEDLERYFQYRFRMETAVQQSSPSLNEITLNWDPSGSIGGPQSYGPTVTPVRNPESSDFLELVIGSPSGAMARLDLFDISGRLRGRSELELPQGYSTVTLIPPAPGLYFIVLEAEGLRAIASVMITSGQF